MRILFLTQIVPYPPDAGPKVKTWHVLRYLVEHGHEVILACFVRPEEEEHLSSLRGVCDSLHTVPIRRSRTADAWYWLRAHATGRPFLLERDRLPAMDALVGRLLVTDSVQVVHADQLSMVQFALRSFSARQPLVANSQGNSDAAGAGSAAPCARPRRPRVVFDAHNAVWTLVNRMRPFAHPLLRPFLEAEASRLRRFEGIAVCNSDFTLAVTQSDKVALAEAARACTEEWDPLLHRNGARIQVIPIGIDTDTLQPVRRCPGGPNILALGTLHYPPNADGIRWFANEVLSLVREQIPGARLTIVGKNPPPDLTRRASRNPESISVTGYVPDLGPYLEQAALMVVPVRAGGGMRVRILEAFARGIPVVTTGIGLEGIEATPDTHILVGNTPHEFAGQVVRLLKDEALQVRLADNARRLAVQRYDWQVVLEQLDEVYGLLGERFHG